MRLGCSYKITGPGPSKKWMAPQPGKLQTPNWHPEFSSMQEVWVRDRWRPTLSPTLPPSSHSPHFPQYHRCQRLMGEARGGGKLREGGGTVTRSQSGAVSINQVTQMHESYCTHKLSHIHISTSTNDNRQLFLRSDIWNPATIALIPAIGTDKSPSWSSFWRFFHEIKIFKELNWTYFSFW